ncbi:MAG: DUF3667 domain-containing protein [bacterium]|nr:DUF3667 domain-containing protein [bacterium]
MEQTPEELTGTPCLNCGDELTGNFCANCGQQVRDVNISVKSLAVEFTESLFSLEFGFWQTFKRLVFLPGTLTAEYVAGRRKKYSSPIRLYLGTSLLFFFAIGFFGGDKSFIQVGDDDGNVTAMTGDEAMAALREGFADTPGDSMAGAPMDSLLADIPANEKIGDLLRDPDRAKQRLFSYLPRAMFLMVPISALLFRLAYVRHKRPYLHYLVFSLHLHALFYFTATVSGLLGLIRPEAVGDSLALIVLVTFPINTVRAQRRAFGDSWWKALLKAGLVWHVYGFILTLVIFSVLVLMVVTA